MRAGGALLLLLLGPGRRLLLPMASAGTAPGDTTSATMGTAPGDIGDTTSATAGDRGDTAAGGTAGGGTAGDRGGTAGDRGGTGADPGYVPGTVSAAFVTCPNLSVATELARALVQQRLAACVNILPGVTSVYMWQGKMEEDSEVLLMIKTRSSRVPALTEFIRSQHPYEVPEVVALPVAQGNLPYLRWVGDAVPP